MIRINLLGETVDKSGVYFLQLLGFVCSIIFTLGACYLVQDSVSTDLALKKKEAKLYEQKLVKLKRITKKVSGLEEKKKVLREKLTVIATLKANKHGPVRVLDELNNAIPERAWLRDIKEKAGVLEINGIALDNQTVSELMANLENSEYFKDVDLVFSMQEIKDEVKLKKFSVTANLVSGLELEKKRSQQSRANGTKQAANESLSKHKQV